MLVSSLRKPVVADHTVRQRLQLRWQLSLFASPCRTPTSVSSVFVVKPYAVGFGVYVSTQGC